MTISDYVRGINGSEERMGDFSSYTLDTTPIGVGGFSKVYRAEKNGRSYAMKIPMNANLASDVTIKYDPEDRGRFMGEAEKWALASDAAPDDVVCLMDYNVEPFPWMVMELGHCSLKDMIASGEATPSDVVALLRSLQNIHDNGIVHRDIKPENVLMVDGRLKFTDFGLSKVVGSLTRSTGGLKGTPFYMAPEQVSSRKFGNVDRRTDIWQMGIVLYEVLKGKVPFNTRDIAEIGMAITLDGPDYSDAPEWAVPVLDRALCQDKDGRFQSAAEFADALEAAVPEAAEERAKEAKAVYDRAMDLLDKGMAEEAAVLLRESADMGCMWAFGQLAYMTLIGKGVENGMAFKIMESVRKGKGLTPSLPCYCFLCKFSRNRKKSHSAVSWYFPYIPAHV